MASKRRVILDRASTAAFNFGQRVFLSGSLERAERRGEKLAMALFRLDKKHRNRTLANLELAFPEWTPEKRLEVAHGVYRHFGRVTADFMRTPLRTDDEVRDAEVIGLEHLKAAKELGKGVLIITAHYGNWERFAHWFHCAGFTLNVVARDANQGMITNKITELRNRAGAEVLSRGNAARAILSKLKTNELVGNQNDQNNGDIFVPFFGKPCGTALGPAVIHLRTGAPLIPSYFTRLGPGKYRAEFHPPVMAEDFGRDQERITIRLNEILESVIRQHPEQWLWLHDRWKSARRRGLF